MTSPRLERWWIATDELSRGGKKLLGPFESRDLALEVRQYVEAFHKGSTFWISKEGE